MQFAKILVLSTSVIFVLLLCEREVSSFSDDDDSDDYYPRLKKAFRMYACYDDDDAPLFSRNEEKKSRIAGGFEIDISCTPYQASIMLNRKHICGGSIIDRKFILTAAHCLEENDVSRYSVRVGSTHSNDGGVIHEVENITLHPVYNPSSLENDIGLITLKKPLQYTSTVEPIALSDSGDPDPIVGSLGLVSGWGLILLDPKIKTTHLRAVQVPIMSRYNCSRMYKDFLVTAGMICAGYESGGKDACIGDSGGPLVKDGIQIGIISWGDECAKPNAPGVYTSVADQRKFIDFVISTD